MAKKGRPKSNNPKEEMIHFAIYFNTIYYFSKNYVLNKK
jgi:hypothetical protein